MAIGLHAAMHFSLELFLTPHTVWRDSISKGRGETEPAGSRGCCQHETCSEATLRSCQRMGPHAAMGVHPHPRCHGCSHRPTTKPPAHPSLISGNGPLLDWDHQLGKVVVSPFLRLFSENWVILQPVRVKAPLSHGGATQQSLRPLWSSQQFVATATHCPETGKQVCLKEHSRAKYSRQRGQTHRGPSQALVKLCMSLQHSASQVFPKFLLV